MVRRTGRGCASSRASSQRTAHDAEHSALAVTVASSTARSSADCAISPAQHMRSGSWTPLSRAGRETSSASGSNASFNRRYRQYPDEHHADPPAGDDEAVGPSGTATKRLAPFNVTLPAASAALVAGARLPRSPPVPAMRAPRSGRLRRYGAAARCSAPRSRNESTSAASTAHDTRGSGVSTRARPCHLGHLAQAEPHAAKRSGTSGPSTHPCQPFTAPGRSRGATPRHLRHRAMSSRGGQSPATLSASIRRSSARRLLFHCLHDLLQRRLGAAHCRLGLRGNDNKGGGGGTGFVGSFHYEPSYFPRT